MKVIYLNVNDNEAPEVLDIPDDINTFYKLIQCTCIDIPRRKIGEKFFNIICDDEGLFVESPKISAVNKYYQTQLVGNLIICSGEIDEENLTGLSEEEIQYVLKRIRPISTRLHPFGYHMVTDCN